MTNQLASFQFGSKIHRRGLLALCFGLFALGLSATVSAQHPKITFFDAPGAGTNGQSPYTAQGTLVHQITFSGAIVGFTRDQNDVRHGFVRSPNGAFTMIDEPDAGGGPGQGTWATGLNVAGAVTGYYQDANDVDHGYVRDRKGKFTKIDVQGALGTWSLYINSAGTIAGFYLDASYTQHGFVRSPNGTITTVDPPGSLSTDITNSAYGSALTEAGAITGDYWVCSEEPPFACTVIGFVRAPNGTFDTFSAPGAGTGEGQGTFPQSIDERGAIAGSYFDENYVYHGFVRAPNGTITTFDAPGACAAGSTCQFQGTATFDINLWGAIAGQSVSADGVSHGWVRAPNGTLAAFDAVHVGTWVSMDTIPVSINFWGQIAGWVNDTTNVKHGFLLTP